MAETSQARRTCVRHAVAPVLPYELVVWEILVLLPAKMLLRCRAVCRSWRHLTSNADFLLAHHQRQPSLPLITFHGETSDSGRDFVDAAVDAFNLRRDPVVSQRHPVLRFDDYNHRRNFMIHASCDGLLVLSLSNNHFYICNPAIRQWAALPKKLICGQAAALYKHSSSGEYRILYWKGNFLVADYYVLTVGSSLEPRYLGRDTASVTPPVLLHNCLHWVLHLSEENKLLVFDTALESFRSMRSPATTDSLGKWAHVFEMDGMLGISCIRKTHTTVDLWVLEDYGMEVWSSKYQIELPVAELRSFGEDCLFQCLTVSEDGDMLVYGGIPNHILLYCDNKGKLLRKFQWGRVHCNPTKQWFKESLVRHKFFERQGRARSQPRFFRGL